ncbi:MAG TPA: methyltransferase domain-containing protein [Burkholderiales bacterium]|nr:methyltransferase domain-containing protein [Burkholderiales bacterium]
MDNKRLNWDPVTHYQDTEIARRYDKERFSRLTGRIFHRLECHFISRAFKSMPRGGKIIDVPCGTGRLAEVLLEDGYKIVGVDISAPMLTVASERLARFGDRFEPQVADVRQMELPAQAYDAALCARVLMHFPLAEQISFLKSVAKLTRGPVVLTQSLSTPYQRFRRRMKRLIGNPAPAGYPITNKELATLLQESGLREVKRFRPMALITEEIIVVAEHNH